MEVNKQVKSSEVLDKCIDMSKVKLDALKAQIKTKIYDIFKIEDFVCSELKLEQFISPLKMHIHMTEYLNGPLVRQFLCELWPILLKAEGSASDISTNPIEPAKNEILKTVLQTKLGKRRERSESSSHPRSREQGNMVNARKETSVPSTTFSSTFKHDESASLSRSTNNGRILNTKAGQKQPLVPPTTFNSTLKPQQRINTVKGGTQPIVPPKTFSFTLKPQGRIDISKVKLNVLKPWINNKIADILQREDNAAVEFVYNKLKQDKMLCPQKLQIRIAGFLRGDKAQKFVCELWPLLLSAQESESGTPAEFMQQKKDENVRIDKDIKRSEKHDESTSPRCTNTEQKQLLTTSTPPSSKKQRFDKENNKNSINIQNQLSKQDKSGTKEHQIDNKSNKLSAERPSQARYKGRIHSSRAASDMKSLSKPTENPPEKLNASGATNSVHPESQDQHRSTPVRKFLSEHCADNDDCTCGSGGFTDICMYSPQQSHQETKAISPDLHPSTPVRQFLSQHCAEMYEFLNDWNKTPEKETVLSSEKFIYPAEKNIEKQMTTTLLPSSSVRQSDQKHLKRNIDLKEVEDEIKAARESRKRTHSTMINESKKSKNNTSDKEVLQSAKKQQTKAKKSSSKRSSVKDSSRKQEAKSSNKKSQKNSNNALEKRMLELFGSCSSFEEELCPYKDSSRKPVAEPKIKDDHKISNNEMHKLEFDLFGSISSDEEERSTKQPSARNTDAVKESHNRQMSTLEADLFISSDEEDV